jgi:hypothetical protein
MNATSSSTQQADGSALQLGQGIIVIKGVYKVVIVFYICIVICNSLILLRTILEHATGLL